MEDILKTKSGETVRNVDPRRIDNFRRLVGGVNVDRIELGEKSMELFPKVGFVGDGSHVEDQHIGVIKEINELIISFKLREDMWRSVARATLNRKGNIVGKMGFSNGENIVQLCPSVQFEIASGVHAEVSLPKDNDIRSFFGKVRVIIKVWPSDTGVNVDKVVKDLIEKIEEFCLSKLKIDQSIFIEPNEDAIRYSKIEQYAWSHKKSPKDLSEKENEEALGLVREEVAPGGYETWIEKGRSAEMEKQAPFFLYHDLFNTQDKIDNIVGRLQGIIKSGGLISTHERYERGSRVEGFSSSSDLRVGGGDGVFLRMMAAPLSLINTTNFYWSEKTRIVFDNSILDRSDNYCFHCDRYGSKEPGEFELRITSEELLDRQVRQGHLASNELVFNRGISADKIRYIIAPSGKRELIINELKKVNILVIGSRPIEEVVIDQCGAWRVMRKIYPNLDTPDKI
ncbi:MAG: hypothetical protein HY225_03630 [Candidatus Vogelbacteria bacterium]|nr:hypothetical protein [Candidatus Vogelbacteria bacterium]